MITLEVIMHTHTQENLHLNIIELIMVEITTIILLPVFKLTSLILKTFQQFYLNKYRST